MTWELSKFYIIGDLFIYYEIWFQLITKFYIIQLDKTNINNTEKTNKNKLIVCETAA